MFVRDYRVKIALNALFHTFVTPGNRPVKLKQGTVPRVSGMGGIFAHDLGLLEHGSHHSNPLKIAVKWLLGPKFSSPAAR